MIGTTVSISQQYLLAGKAKSKLLKCASTEKNKDYDLRILVGHANLLDRLMDNIDSFTYAQRQEEGGSLEYFSSDDEEEEDEEEDFDPEDELHLQESFSDSSSSSESEGEEEEEEEEEETHIESPVGYYGSTPRYSQSVQFASPWEDGSGQREYVPLKLGSPGRYTNTGFGDEQEDYEDDEDDDDDDEESEDELSTDGSDLEQDLSMMPMVLKTDMPISV
ncbi:hypothetical protein ZYGR_0BA01180 [Zygosaccharomyces rouxii]|uniref:Uncharacterized protein n=1 Tax=Zygosaccharomyces rouxii TaxID=4956 RepID=A0A1Q3AKY1_ZYGRO|nr:hypothetical protein ZYGR_0BA01180 [Zygosaccharomyces rouxii]